LVDGVQTEVADLVGTMSQGCERVDKGLTLSQDACNILQAIGESAKKSTQMAREIVEATAEQAGDIGRVDQAMLQVRDIAKQLNRGTREQDNASSEIRKGVERMRQLGQDVKQTIQEQSREIQQITGAVEVVATQVQQILSSTNEQSKQGDQILQALTVFRDVTNQSGQRAEDMKQTVEILSSRANELEGEVGRFNL
jgi:methyl-accepting chemotaxis protein